MSDAMSKGRLYIISAASGTGKTSLVSALLERVSQISVSVSHPTRAPRAGEQNGTHYHFISKEDFVRRQENAEFLEFAQVFGNFYGTSKVQLEKTLAEGMDVILEIDWQGAQQVKKILPEAQSIFILPPSRQALIARLNARGQDSPEVIARRTKEAFAEISHYKEFDYLILNDEFTQALNDLISIISSHRLQQARQSVALAGIIEKILKAG